MSRPARCGTGAAQRDQPNASADHARYAPLAEELAALLIELHVHGRHGDSDQRQGRAERLWSRPAWPHPGLARTLGTLIWR